jgi:site-specific DNA recombinase
MAPEVAAEAMRAYAEETNRLNRERRAGGEADRRELDKITRSIKEIVALVENGSGSRALLARLRELEAREDELRARLAQAPMDIPDIHPNVAGIYRRKVERLADALCQREPRNGGVEPGLMGVGDLHDPGRYQRSGQGDVIADKLITLSMVAMTPP